MSLGALLRTALHAAHGRAGARMVDFAGWDMPVQYRGGILAEHQAVRTACGMFDLSHMGRVHLRGADALALAQTVCTRDLERVPDGEAAYTLVCLPDGGILDDVIAYRLQPHEVLLIVNASNRAADVAWLIEHRERLQLSVEIVDRTLETVLIGIQGPQAAAILQERCDAELDRMAGYSFVAAHVAGRPALVSRTGYTGEDGFEIMLEAADGEHVWGALLAGVQPCGLGARDTLRTEAAFALYGHEIDAHTNPFEARLGWVVNLDKTHDFVGRAALSELKARGPTRRLVGLRIAAGGVPRAGFRILRDGEPVGGLTSGTFSPTLKENIGLGYVPVGVSQPGQQFAVELRGKPADAEITRLPFVPHRSRPRATM